MKAAHVVTSDRPMKGSVVYVRAAAMQSSGACTSALHLTRPAGDRWLDRDEVQVHPGEGSA